MRASTIEKRAKKRAEIIQVGMAIFTQRGFYSIGLDELVAAADIPKGSFYYYFDSKDEFALSVVAAYGEYFARKISSHLDDATQPPLSRLRAFCDAAMQGVERFEFSRGCLIGNIGQEMGAMDESFRLMTRGVLQDWRDRVERCLQDAIRAGDLEPTANPHALAEFFWSAWEGAVMCAKLERSLRPMQTVTDTLFKYLLRPPSASAAPPASTPAARRPPRVRK